MSIVTDVHSVKDGQTFRGDTKLVVCTCPSCFIRHAIPARLDQAARDWPGEQPQGWTIHCPMGHSWVYGGENLKQRAEKAEAAAERARNAAARARADRDQARASASAYKGVATKAKKRVGNGVCPCCNRTFQQLARHMQAKHPDYSEAS